MTTLERWSALAESVAVKIGGMDPDQGEEAVGMFDRAFQPFLESGDLDSLSVASIMSDVAKDVHPTWRENRAALCVAFHESGHTVAAVDFGIAFSSVSNRRHWDSGGRLTLDGDLAPDAPRTLADRERVEQAIIMQLAGPFAEQKFASETGFSYGNERDFDRHVRHVEELALRSGGVTEAELPAFTMWMLARARAFVARRWPAIRVLAKQLATARSMGPIEVSRLLATLDAPVETDPVPAPLVELNL